MSSVLYFLDPRLLNGFIFLMILTACSVEVPEDLPAEEIEGAWVVNSPYKWDHDGYPCFSRYCIVFSDSATMEMKESAGKFTDSRFEWILQQFNFTSPGEFLFPQGNDRIHVYLNLTHEERIAAAFWGTVIFSFPRQEIDTSRLDYLFRHELTHAFEYLIEGTVELGTDVWFREGMAIYMGGGMHVIHDTAGLNQWISRNSGSPNAGNPISIHEWEDFPEGSDITGYYTVFDIVMMYILDEKGLNRELSDILSIFYDVRNGLSFESTFKDRIGISLREFEESIIERLGNYLPGSS